MWRWGTARAFGLEGLRPASTGHDRPGWGRTGPSKGANTANVTRQTDAPELADLLETVERLRPVIEEYAAAAEADRHLAEPVYRAMFDAGLFAMTAPGRWGTRTLDLSRVNAIQAIFRPGVMLPKTAAELGF